MKQQQQRKPKMSKQQPLILLVNVPIQITASLQSIAHIETVDSVKCVNEIPQKLLTDATVCVLSSELVIAPTDIIRFKQIKHLFTYEIHQKSIDDYSIENMADSTMSFILCLYRKPHLIGFGARRIANSVLGLIGLDAIGLAVVDRARPHRFRIIFYDPNAPIGIDHALGIERMSSVEQLISIADCVSLHCDHRHNNFRCIINSHTLMQFKRGAFLINTSNRNLINDRALVDALKTGQISAAAIDIDTSTGNDLNKSNIYAELPDYCYMNTGGACYANDDNHHLIDNIRAVLQGRLAEL